MNQQANIRGITTTAQAAKELGLSQSRIRQMILQLRAEGHPMSTFVGHALVLSAKEFQLIKNFKAALNPPKGGRKQKRP